MRAEHFDHLVANDFDDLLAGRQRGEHFFAHGLLLDFLDELLNDFEMNVGFEQRHADLAQSLFHVGRREFAFAAEVLKDALQLVGKVVEHEEGKRPRRRPGNSSIAPDHARALENIRR